MPARRPLATTLATAALLLAATGCQKPTPNVTMVSGREAAHAEAYQFCRNGEALTRVDGTQCRGTGKQVTILRAKQDAVVSVDVDSALAKTGWFVFDPDARRSYGLQDEHYTTLVADYTGRPVPGVINLEVRQLDHKPTSDADIPKVTGVWKFQLIVT